jgi:hypothetical protein
MPTDFWGKSNFTATQRAIFGFGQTTPAGTRVNTTNLVSNAGVVASDVTGIGTARRYVGATGYGGDKAIFAYGNTGVPISTTDTNNRNLVSNTGVLASDTPGAGTARNGLAASPYGSDKGIFFGTGAVTNLVSNTGVVASDTPAVPGVVGKDLGGGATYGGNRDKAIFAYGRSGPTTGTNTIALVSNTGVISATTPGAGTARYETAAAGYGNDKAIFAYGRTIPSPVYQSVSNLVSNTGVLASDTPGVGTIRAGIGAATYNADKAIFAFGAAGPTTGYNISNLVSNTGVVASNTPGVGQARNGLAAGTYSYT